MIPKDMNQDLMDDTEETQEIPDLPQEAEEIEEQTQEPDPQRPIPNQFSLKYMGFEATCQSMETEVTQLGNLLVQLYYIITKKPEGKPPSYTG